MVLNSGLVAGLVLEPGFSYPLIWLAPRRNEILVEWTDCAMGKHILYLRL